MTDPKLRERLQQAWDASATLPPIVFAEHEADALIAALSPQTLPAPGEVERPLDRNDLYRFMDTLKLSEKREVASAIGFDPAYVPGERDFDRWKRMWLWAAENDKKPALAVAIRSSLPTLATVAAANDEGVAVALDRQVRIAAWNAAKKSGASDALGYAVVESVVAEFAAIRLLSQGGGK